MRWKGLIIRGIIGIILVVLFTLVLPYICADFFKIGPDYPSNQPVCKFFLGAIVWISVIIFILSLLTGWFLIRH